MHAAIRICITFAALVCVIQLVLYALQFSAYSAASASLVNVRTQSSDTTNSDAVVGAADTHSTNKTDPKNMTADEFLEWCHDLHTENMYTVGYKLGCKANSEVMWLSFTIAVTATLAIEVFTHILETKVFKNNVVIREMLQKIYKELMMLGMISFVVSVIHATHALELVSRVFPSPFHETELEAAERHAKIFEYVHISLFILSLFYVIICALTLGLVRITWRRFGRFEKEGLERTLEKYRTVVEQGRGKGILWKMFNWRWLYRYSASVEQLNYHSVRRRFLVQTKLSNDFQFNKYMMMRLQALLMKLIDLSWKVWLLVFLVCVASYVITKLTDAQDTENALLYVPLVQGLSLLGIIIVFLALRIGYQRYINMHSVRNKVNRALESEPTFSETAMVTLLEADQIADSESSNQSATRIIDMHKFFMFRAPSVTFLLIQCILLTQSFYLSQYILRIAYVIIQHDYFDVGRTGSWFVAFLVLIPSFVICFVFLPLSIPPFGLLWSVDSMTGPRTLRRVLDKYVIPTSGRRHGHSSSHADNDWDEDHLDANHGHGHGGHHEEDGASLFSSTSEADREQEREILAVSEYATRRQSQMISRDAALQLQLQTQNHVENNL